MNYKDCTHPAVSRISEKTAKALRIGNVTYSKELDETYVETGYGATLVFTCCTRMKIVAYSPKCIVTLADCLVATDRIDEFLLDMADQWSFAGIWCADYSKLREVIQSGGAGLD